MSGSKVMSRPVFLRHEGGAAAVEFGLIGSSFVLLIVAVMDFGSALWQWNQASKAVQLGVRLAAVSSPVSSDLKTLDGTSSGAEPGDPMPYFRRVCSGSGLPPSCSDGGVYDAAAMRTIVYGRGNSSCPTTPQNFPPMCTLFPRIRPENIVIEYVQSGLGFAGRPGGPVPTINLRLTGLDYDFMILNKLLGLKPIPMNGLSATATAEDLAGS